MQTCNRCNMEIKYPQMISIRGKEVTHANMQECVDSLLDEIKRLREIVIVLESDLNKVRGIDPNGKKQEAYQWYRILDSWSISKLETYVDNLMIEGWIPCGGISVATLISDQATFHFYQAMRRTE